MKHVIIGTAGHVDHGKTQLVRALTGVDTDRLAEEKRRGLTIETGFARLDFPDGSHAGVVDVPGHEKFIKNMLAGAGGIDLAMLVVAADEGFMPQTAEHLNILSLLGVQSGVVVLSKCDLADAAQLARVREEIAARVDGTFLAHAPVAEVSAITGQGIGELRGLLHALVQRTAEKNSAAPFRLPIDRVFSVDGFGTVVTGTLIEGTLRRLDEAELLSSGRRTPVRALQVHGETVDEARAGQRVAVNLAAVRREEIPRGDCLARPGSVRRSRMLDVRLTCLRDSARTILDGSRVHFYHGTSSCLAKVALLDRSALEPGASAYAQLRFTEEVAVKCGDRFILRFYSPLETIGGGIVLDDVPARHKRNDPAVLESLAVREHGSAAERTLRQLDAFDTSLPTAHELADRLALADAELTALLTSLTAQGSVLEPLPGRYLAPAALSRLIDRCAALLADYHEKNPLHAGMRLPELRRRLLRAADSAEWNALFRSLTESGRICCTADRAALADFTPRYTARQSELRQELLSLYRGMGYRPMPVRRVLARLSPADRREAERVLESLLADGALVLLAPELYLHAEHRDRAYGVLRAHFAAQETLTLAAMRDALGCSRDDALALLEYFDHCRVTKREGNVRRADRNFMP